MRLSPRKWDWVKCTWSCMYSVMRELRTKKSKETKTDKSQQIFIWECSPSRDCIEFLDNNVMHFTTIGMHNCTHIFIHFTQRVLEYGTLARSSVWRVEKPEEKKMKRRRRKEKKTHYRRHRAQMQCNDWVECNMNNCRSISCNMRNLSMVFCCFCCCPMVVQLGRTDGCRCSMCRCRLPRDTRQSIDSYAPHCRFVIIYVALIIITVKWTDKQVMDKYHALAHCTWTSLITLAGGCWLSWRASEGMRFAVCHRLRANVCSSMGPMCDHDLCI